MTTSKATQARMMRHHKIRRNIPSYAIGDRVSESSCYGTVVDYQPRLNVYTVLFDYGFTQDYHASFLTRLDDDSNQLQLGYTIGENVYTASGENAIVTGYGYNALDGDYLIKVQVDNLPYMTVEYPQNLTRKAK